MSKIQTLIKPTTPFQRWEANVYTEAILTLIDKYVDKHGDIALSCGSEWMYQDDEGQVDALNLVANILDALQDFSEDEDEDGEYLSERRVDDIKIGYIAQYDLELNPHLTERFKFKEATFTRRISSRGDRVYSKMLAHPVDYEEIVSTANMMKNDGGFVVVKEPFLLDDELREKCIKWVEWANKADPKEYDPFYTKE